MDCHNGYHQVSFNTTNQDTLLTAMATVDTLNDTLVMQTTHVGTNMRLSSRGRNMDIKDGYISLNGELKIKQLRNGLQCWTNE